MRRHPACAPLALLLLWLVMSLSGCAVQRQQSQPTDAPPMPSAELMTDDLSESSAYSQSVLDWLKKARDELESLLQRKPGCNVTQPKSGGCS